MPGLGPGTPFRRGVSPGVAPAAGVEAASASEALSAEEGRTAGRSAADEAGEERSAALISGGLFWLVLDLLLGLPPTMARRDSGGSFRTTIKESLAEFLEPPVRPARPLVDVEVAAGMVGCPSLLSS